MGSDAVRSFRDLNVWRNGVALTALVYPLAKLLPRDEQYALGSQLRRAAVSIPANIAEGHGRRSTGAYLYHLSIARGSLAEVESLIAVAQSLELLSDQQASPALIAAETLNRMLAGLISALRNRPKQ